MSEDQVQEKREEIERTWDDLLVKILREKTIIHNIRFQSLPDGSTSSLTALGSMETTTHPKNALE